MGRREMISLQVDTTGVEMHYSIEKHVIRKSLAEARAN